MHASEEQVEINVLLCRKWTFFGSHVDFSGNSWRKHTSKYSGLYWNNVSRLVSYDIAAEQNDYFPKSNSCLTVSS